MYNILKKEIDRHIVDIEYAKATQYAAAERSEKQHKYFLLFGFILTLLGISCLLCAIVKTCPYVWIGECISFFGAFCTLWPLIKDYSGRAVTHRRSAEELNNLYKKSLNWETDFYNTENIEHMRNFVKSIRDTYIIISNLAPATSYKDYIKAQENIKSGSYKYEHSEVQDKTDKNNRNIESMETVSQNYILQAQNTSAAIQLISASRVLYTKSKQYGYIDMVIAVLSLGFFIFNIVMTLSETCFNIVSWICALCACVIVAIGKLQKDKTVLAAQIQEKFDNEIFKLPQNKILTPDYPSIEVITKYANEYKKNDMSNWYMEYLIKDYPHFVAVLRCQLANLLWDKQQRNAFKSCIIMLLIAISVAFILVNYILDYSFSYSIQLLAILSPLIVYLVKSITGNDEIIESKDNLIKYTLSLWNKYKEEGIMPTEQELRELQNNIYIQRTSVHTMISDVWYMIAKAKAKKHVEQVINNL